MLDVCLLGTGGMMPLPNRWLTSLLLRYNGSSLLIDCGEGTQVALRKTPYSPKPIDVICITHFHADHVSGLPGFLLTMGNAGRVEPVTIIGPKGVERIVSALRVIAQDLPFDINYIELEGQAETIRLNGYVINAFRVNHNVVCYGYCIEIERAGKFDAVRAKELNIPVCLWNKLQKGITQECNGVVYEPEMVMGPDRKGLKVTYTTDSRPTQSILDYATDADLFICEGMYGDQENLYKAKDKKHMTMYEAAEIAKNAGAKEMWLTHYSPSLVRPDEFIDEVRKIYSGAVAARDGRNVTLNFQGE